MMPLWSGGMGMLEQVNLDALTESELIELNQRIVQRLRLMHQIRTHKDMLDFMVGERVEFESQSGQLVSGVVVRFNRKTVTVVTKDGRRWNVSPCFLRKDAIDVAAADNSKASELRLPRE
jgi:hypothetical protein